MIAYLARRVLSWLLVGGPLCPVRRCGRRYRFPNLTCVEHPTHVDDYGAVWLLHPKEGRCA